MTWLDIAFAATILACLMWGATQLFRMFFELNADGAERVNDLDPELVDLRERKGRLLEDLRDIELDFRMNKISEADYRRQKKTLEPQAIAVIRELDDRLGIGDEGDEGDVEEDEHDSAA